MARTFAYQTSPMLGTLLDSEMGREVLNNNIKPALNKLVDGFDLGNIGAWMKEKWEAIKSYVSELGDLKKEVNGKPVVDADFTETPPQQ